MHTQHQELRHRWKHSRQPPFMESFPRGLRKHGKTCQSDQIVLTKNPLVSCRDQTGEACACLCSYCSLIPSLLICSWTFTTYSSANRERHTSPITTPDNAKVLHNLCFEVGTIYNTLINRIQGQEAPLDNPSLTLCGSQAINILSSHSFIE